MESVTIKSKLDFKTYFKISLLNVYSRRFAIIMLVVTPLIVFYSLPDGRWEWNSGTQYAAFILLFYFVIIPILAWWDCKRRMRQFPALFNEGCDIIISNDGLETQSSSSNSKTAWPYIKKVAEKDNYFAIYTQTNAMHYLPKSGFASAGDIDLFRQIIRNNDVKARLK